MYDPRTVSILKCGTQVLRKLYPLLVYEPELELADILIINWMSYENNLWVKFYAIRKPDLTLELQLDDNKDGHIIVHYSARKNTKYIVQNCQVQPDTD